ncbi:MULTISPECIES: GNAT family N-acetyltransferase [Undibacterium]|uniref:GNAT family N-acetyltransferase n=1 Tax=Undibacterium TaxID=401469 RepID=UPI0013896DD9|nr:GNAT family N-acetyltransferase [Undibacterium crateris]NDI87335.1 GNAT family N-acetyltransferase [Undibacterium crateris]
MISLRPARPQDAQAVADLLAELDYPGSHAFIESRIKQLLSHPDATLIVAVDEQAVLGCISLHFIPQLALAGDFCRISYFCVADGARNRGIGALLEQRAVQLAADYGCDRIEVHCHERRTDAHRFYARQGYAESPKYFNKKIS